MDEDLENYVRELERIDRADNPMLNKSMQMQVGQSTICTELMVATELC